MAGHIPTGMLRIPMEVQNPVRTVDLYGQASEAWVTVGVVHCHVEQANTAEVIDDRGVAVRTDFRILASWHPELNTRSRLRWTDYGRTRTFSIRTATDRDQRRSRFEIEAVEVEP